MSPAALDDFLETAGDGVLTLHADEPYSFPVSFGYDPATERCVLQLVSAPDSAKRAVLDDGTDATLVAYEWNAPDDWRSVVVSGALSRVPDDDAAHDVYAEQATPVGMSVFGAGAQNLDAEWYELDASSRSGRRSPR